MWDLVPQPGIEPGFPALVAQSLSHWTTREVSGKLQTWQQPQGRLEMSMEMPRVSLHGSWVNLKSKECYKELEKVFKHILEYFYSKVMGRPVCAPGSPDCIPGTSVLLTQHLYRSFPVVSKGPGCQELTPAIRHLSALSVVSPGMAQLWPMAPGLMHLLCQLCQLWFSTTHQEEARPRLCEAASSASIWGLGFMLCHWDTWLDASRWFYAPLEIRDEW